MAAVGTSIQRGGRSVRLSNAAVEKLYELWAAAVAPVASGAADAAVVRWLEHEASSGYGAGFDADDPPEPLGDGGLALLERGLASLVERVAAGERDLEMDDDAFRRRWLARLLDVAEVLGCAVPEVGEADADAVALQRLRWRIERTPRQERLPLLDEAIALAGEPGETTGERAVWLDLHYERADVLVELGRDGDAVQELEVCLGVEEDEEMRQAAVELLEALRGG